MENEAVKITQFYNLLTSSIDVIRNFSDRIPGILELSAKDRDLLFQSACLELFTLRLAYRSSNVNILEFSLKNFVSFLTSLKVKSSKVTEFVCWEFHRNLLIRISNHVLTINGLKEFYWHRNIAGPNLRAPNSLFAVAWCSIKTKRAQPSETGWTE